MSNCNRYAILVIDVYSLFYKSFYHKDQGEASLQKEKQPKGILNFLDAFESILEKHGYGNETRIYWFIDNSKIVSRKSKRASLIKGHKAESPWFYTQLNLLEAILKNYRPAILSRLPGVTDNQTLVSALDIFKRSYEEVLIVSDDVKYFRELKETVHQLCNNSIITLELFKRQFQFSPSSVNICFYKAFYGDPSSGIRPALPHFPYDTFLEILNKYFHISSFLDDARGGLLSMVSYGWVEQILKQEPLLALNWSIASYMSLEDYDLTSVDIVCNYNKMKLKLLRCIAAIDSGVVGSKEDMEPIEEKNDLIEMLK